MSVGREESHKANALCGEGMRPGLSVTWVCQDAGCSRQSLHGFRTGLLYDARATHFGRDPF
jgi:hypothetical protein